MKKVIHYINQFFGQVGGEEKADMAPELREGTVGPAQLLDSMLADAEVTHTIIGGDNHMTADPEGAVKDVLAMLDGIEFDLFVAGPSFLAGRYANACGQVGKAVSERFGVPVVTAMNEENPGVEMFVKDMYIFPAGRKATSMKKDLTRMTAFINRIVAGEELRPAAEEGYFPRGIRHQYFLDEPVQAADRVVDMLLRKLNGEPVRTELPIPKTERIPIAEAVSDLSKARVALVTSGGIVPSDNPDHIQSASATKWGKYDISELDVLPAGEYKTIHAGFDPAAANANPNRILPLDAVKTYLKEGKFGSLHPFFYSTVGTGTSQGEAARMGREIAAELHEAEIDAVLLVAT